MPDFKELIVRDSECGAEILAFIEASGKWEAVAVIQPTSSVCAKALAEFIADIVNDAQRHGDILDAACETLEAIVNLGLNYCTDENANEVITRIKSCVRRGSRQNPSETGSAIALR